MSRKIPAPEWVNLCAPYNPAPEPGDPAVAICGLDPTPPARLALLMTADSMAIRAGFGGYAMCGHMVDGADVAGGRQIHRAYVVWAPGTRYAVMHATRCGSIFTGSSQADSKVSDDSTFPADITVGSPLLGSPEPYMETGTTQVQLEHVTTGTVKGGATALRAIERTPAAEAQIGIHEIQYASGWCFEPFEGVTDLETL